MTEHLSDDLLQQFAESGGPLPDGVGEHLRFCSRCQDQLDEYRGLLSALDQAPPPPDDFLAGVQAALPKGRIARTWLQIGTLAAAVAAVLVVLSLVDLPSRYSRAPDAVFQKAAEVWPEHIAIPDRASLVADRTTRSIQQTIDQARSMAPPWNGKLKHLALPGALFLLFLLLVNLTALHRLRRAAPPEMDGRHSQTGG